MNSVLSYKKVKESVFDRITQEERNSLFYCSLFDPSSWEETNKANFLAEYSESEELALNLLSNDKKIKERIEKDREKFCRYFISSEKLNNYLLAYQMEQYSDNKLTVDSEKLSKNNNDFPDIVLKNKDKSIYIEVKRLISADKLKERINDEVIEAIKKDKKKFKNILLLLIFPVLKGENAQRISQLIKGYYIYETIIKDKTGVNCNVLCLCFKAIDDGYCLKPLCLKVLDNSIVKNQVECVNINKEGL